MFDRSILTNYWKTLKNNNHDNINCIYIKKFWIIKKKSNQLGESQQIKFSPFEQKYANLEYLEFNDEYKNDTTLLSCIYSSILITI